MPQKVIENLKSILYRLCYAFLRLKLEFRHYTSVVHHPFTVYCLLRYAYDWRIEKKGEIGGKHRNLSVMPIQRKLETHTHAEYSFPVSILELIHYFLHLTKLAVWKLEKWEILMVVNQQLLFFISTPYGI